MECREIGVGWYTHLIVRSSKEYYTLRYAKHAVPVELVEQIPPHNAIGAYHSTQRQPPTLEVAFWFSHCKFFNRKRLSSDALLQRRDLSTRREYNNKQKTSINLWSFFRGILHICLHTMGLYQLQSLQSVSELSLLILSWPDAKRPSAQGS